jgi:hypothetical protein
MIKGYVKIMIVIRTDDKSVGWLNVMFIFLKYVFFCFHVSNIIQSIKENNNEQLSKYLLKE